MEIELYKLNRILNCNEFRKTGTTSCSHSFSSRVKKDIKTSNIAIKTFIQTIHYSQRIIKIPPHSRHNLTFKEKEALKDLQQDSTIVIRPADKGGAIVIQAYHQYKKEIMRQLQDAKTYKKFTFDPVKKFQQRINQLIEIGLQGSYIDSNTAKYLQVEFPIHPVLYTIPKIHKSAQEPPGRPIVSARGGLLEPIA
ncbi:Hypothetical predicted protein, partial [Pelobates cultripes]